MQAFFRSCPGWVSLLVLARDNANAAKNGLVGSSSSLDVGGGGLTGAAVAGTLTATVIVPAGTGTTDDASDPDPGDDVPESA